MRPMVLDQGVLKTKPIQGRMTIGSAKKNTAPALNKLRRIMKTGAPRICLIRSLGGFGDVLMTTPSIKALKHEWPASHITYATDFKYGGGVLKDVLQYNPYIDELVAYQTVGNREFDIAADITSVSLTLEHAAVGKPGGVQNRIDIFANAIGVSLEETGRLPTYVVLEKETEWAKMKLQRAAVRKNQILIGIQVSASTDTRNWPIAKMKEFVCTLAQDPRFKVVVFASSYSPHPNEDWNYVGVEVIKDINFRYGAAMLNEMDVVVAPDSGLLHVAGALNKKIVAIFGPTDPAARINYYPNATAVTVDRYKCSPCWYNHSVCNGAQPCLKEISIEDVYTAVLKKIQEPLKKSTELITSSKVIGEDSVLELPTRPSNVSLKAIGVQRDFGGAGDIVCVTCAVKDIKERNPDRDVIVAVPGKYKDIFKHNPHVSKCVEPYEMAHEDVFKIFNLSTVDAVKEVKQLKQKGKITTTRPGIYVQTVGGDIEATESLTPSLYVTEKEEEWAKKRYIKKTKGTKEVFITTVLRTAETYRDWPLENYFELFRLAKKQHKNWRFVITDAKRNESDLPSNVLDASGFSLRKLFAITKLSDYVLTPDTALLHVAAAFDKPCIALFGPIDPAARCKHYKNVYVVKSKDCTYMPCWRNATTRCQKKRRQKPETYSACMEMISASKMLEMLETIIKEEKE